MGANMDTRTYRMNDRAAITKKWADDVQTSRHENGSSYSGCIGMLGEKIVAWHDLKLPSENEAARFISNHHDKWNPGIAVSFYVAKPLTDADKAAATRAREEVFAAEKNLNETRNAVLAEIKAHSRPFATCPLCKSKLARAKLTSLRCPLCPGKITDHATGIYEGAGYLTTVAQDKKIAGAVKRLAAARANCEVAVQPKKSDQIGWIIGGMCSS